MAHKIDCEVCVACGACDDNCPVEAISAPDDCRVIDADACTDCGACVDLCPADAISEDNKGGGLLPPPNKV